LSHLRRERRGTPLSEKETISIKKKNINIKKDGSALTAFLPKSRKKKSGTRKKEVSRTNTIKGTWTEQRGKRL